MKPEISESPSYPSRQLAATARAGIAWDSTQAGSAVFRTDPGDGVCIDLQNLEGPITQYDGMKSQKPSRYNYLGPHTSKPGLLDPLRWCFQDLLKDPTTQI